MQVVYICTVGSFFLGVLRCQIIKVNHTVYSRKNFFARQQPIGAFYLYLSELASEMSECYQFILF